MLNRRDFVSGSLTFAASGPALPGAEAEVPSGPVRLRIGLLSDIHITRRESCAMFEKALRTFDDWKVDGVLCCGDIADWGVAPQIGYAAETWFKVFPKGLRSDGAPVANLLHYGDHDCSGYTYRNHPHCREDYPDVGEMKKVMIRYADRKAIWEKAFKEEWAPIVHKRVKGYDFVLSHFTCGEKGNEWGNRVPGLEDFFAKLEPELVKGRPFFYSQHRIPRGTLGNESIYGQDEGQTTELFSRFPDLCVFCGHKHLTATDEQAIWQGPFTCVQVPSLSYCCTQGGRDNGYADSDNRCRPPDWLMPIIPLGQTKQGLLLTVHDRAMVISRHDLLRGKKLGPDWTVPLPLSGIRPFDYGRRAEKEIAPRFPAGSSLSVKRRAKKERDGKEHDVFELTFPVAPASGGALHANDYEAQISTLRDGVERVIATKRVYSRRFIYPQELDAGPVACDFEAAEILPRAYHPLRFSVRPMGAFGAAGSRLKMDFKPAELEKLAAKEKGEKA
ncbi:MAG: metallophosphoesterase [Kiritimatiellae bacterium]|nr:metallophosphoesterase [Kiritimatiellia bacterium]